MPSRPFVPSSPVTVSLDGGLPRLKPLAQIIALLMVAGGAQASQPFSAAWFAAKGAQQSAGAARPGAQLPGMTPPPLAQQQKVNQQLQRSLQNLNNTVAAIAAQQAAQAAGRQAALAAPTALLQRLAAVRGRLSLCADQAAAAKWWLSMPMASVSAEGPMPKALSTRRTSPLMPGCRHQGRACPLRRARMTSNPLIVA